MDNNESFTLHCKEPYVGMPIYIEDDFEENLGNANDNILSGNCENINETTCTPNSCLENWVLAMAYVPMQEFKNIYEAKEGLNRGTIFKDLDFPFMGGVLR